MKKPILVLTGPTAVGKTALSIALAKRMGGEIISADSMQVYRYMDIGTAKIRSQEREGIPHYLIDEWEPDEEFNVCLFQQRAKEYIEDIYGREKLPMLVGGTGFYIQAVLYDIAFTQGEQENSYRGELMRFAAERGAHALHERLALVDRESALSIHENNIKRVVRALEYYHFTGEKFSVHNEQQRKRESPYSFFYAVLTLPRTQLYERIDSRVDQMMREGLVEEVRQLLDRGYSRSLVSMQGLGYKEIAAALEGEISLDEAVRQLKRDTRHFAKRQMTWFRREKNVNFFPKESFSTEKELADAIVTEASAVFGKMR